MKVLFRILFIDTLLFSAGFFAVLTVSCSGSNNTPIFPEGDTLLSIINEKDAKTDWFSEAPAEERDFNARRPDNQVNVTINNYMALRGQYAGNVTYPEISGFANLDISLLSGEQIEAIEKFSASVLAADLDSALAASSKETSILVQIFFSDMEMMKIKFARYIYGQPLIENALWQIPVRFIAESNAFFDIWLYIDNAASSYQINQIAYKDSEYD